MTVATKRSTGFDEPANLAERSVVGLVHVTEGFVAFALGVLAVIGMLLAMIVPLLFLLALFTGG